MSRYVREAFSICIGILVYGVTWAWTHDWADVPIEHLVCILLGIALAYEARYAFRDTHPRHEIRRRPRREDASRATHAREA